MALVSNSQLFDERFNTYIKEDYTDYFMKLINYSSSYRNISNSISNRVELFKSAVQSDALQTVRKNLSRSIINTNDVKKCIAEKIAMVGEYLYSKNPHDAIKSFLKDDYYDLMKKATRYYTVMKDEIVQNCDEVSSSIPLESVGYKPLKQLLTDLKSQAISRSDISMIYTPMGCSDSFIDKNDLLIKVLKASRNISIEADIISKFSIPARQFINQSISRLELDDNYNTGWFVNSCEAILYNYTFMSIFSSTPENLKMSEKMFYDISKELQHKQVTIDEIKLAIMEGPIKFSEEEIDYIFDYFIKRVILLEDKYTVSESNILSLVRQSK